MLQAQQRLTKGRSRPRSFTTPSTPWTKVSFTASIPSSTFSIPRLGTLLEVKMLPCAGGPVCGSERASMLRTIKHQKTCLWLDEGLMFGPHGNKTDANVCVDIPAASRISEVQNGGVQPDVGPPRSLAGLLLSWSLNDRHLPQGS